MAFNAVAWTYVHLRGRTVDGGAGPGWVVDLVLNGVAGAATHPDERRHVTMTLPYTEPLDPREPGARVIPSRRGAASPAASRAASAPARRPAPSGRTSTWTLHPPGRRQPPGAVWLASREHVDSFSDLSPEAARPTSARGRAGRARDPCRWATSGASTSTAGATAARTSTSGSCRGRSAWSRPGHDAAALGGRPPERPRRGARARRPERIAARAVTARPTLARRLGTATRSSSGSAR